MDPVTLVILFVGVVVVLLFVGWVVSMYNSLISMKRRVDQAKQNIDVLLKQRQDELTKLIDAASEVMGHEEDVLIRLTEARERAEKAESPTEQANADQEIREAMAGFKARFEAYPELRSQSNMMQFQERISDIESQIADRREFYNEAVTRHNTRISQFPYLLFARQFGFDEVELFTASEEAKQDVDVAEAFA